MKIIFILGFIALTTFCNAQIVSFPDINFKNKLLEADATNTIAKDTTGVYFKIDSNNNGEIEVGEALKVGYLDLICQTCPDNLKITSVEGIQYFTNLTRFMALYNKISSIDLGNLNQLTFLALDYNEFTTIDVHNLTELEYFWCSHNHLQNLDVSGLSKLYRFGCFNNELTSLDVSNLTQLDILNCSYNQLTNLNLQNAPELSELQVDHNQLTSLNLEGIHLLFGLLCNNNLLSTLNVSDQHDLGVLQCQSNQLVTLFMKNGSLENENIVFPLNITDNPGLTYVCCDPAQLSTIMWQTHNYPNCSVNSYCTFYPGGEFFLFNGNTKLDENLNGCDSTDRNIGGIKFSVTDGTITDTYITNNLGDFCIPLKNSSYTVTPVLDNPTYFMVEPNQLYIPYSWNSDPVYQDFCISPIGNHNDLEVGIFPINNAQPGFDLYYRIIYKNHGTSIQEGSINVTFEDAITDYVSSVPAVTNQVPNLLTWNFTNLLPLEQREIIVTLNLNSPAEDPPVNNGDILNYSATIVGLTDETPEDNTANLSQEVVNSFDPNDKTCLEGSSLSPGKIGEYVSYMIRFENNGTANAQNVVVEDIINTGKFDINTLIPLKGSHTFETRITGTNHVEFVFENIDLPFDDANNDGFIAFKIKSKSTLASGDAISNTASIYFDYNVPIVTNTYVTTYETLGVNDISADNKVPVFPNPVKELLSFNTKEKVFRIEVYDCSGRILSSNSVYENKADLSKLKDGNYFIKIYTEHGISYTTIIKE
ncbi:MAG: T9SS type A sorting domain-containing protein [Bacteroidales bacterium]|nr:T9SS type A sorting domain-containing protein [Bacteroidales bacterium]